MTASRGRGSRLLRQALGGALNLDRTALRTGHREILAVDFQMTPQGSKSWGVGIKKKFCYLVGSVFRSKWILYQVSKKI